jgi:hypothetical protein
MPCNHKFQKYLNLDSLDFEPTTLIVGTFNPEWPEHNTAEWFYGRTDTCYFWDILPRLYGEQSLLNAHTTEWKQFCKDKKIALTDLISAIDDAEQNNKAHNRMLGGFSDDAIEYNFDGFEFVSIAGLLKRNPSIQHVYLTRTITDAFWRHLWNPVAHYCNHNKLSERKLLTPTTEAAFHHEQHNRDQPGDTVQRLEDYVLRRWSKEWHF